MSLKEEVKKLASLVTFRQLYDDGKCDIYYIVSQFVEGIILNLALYSFEITEITEKIKVHYGFAIPDYVIQTSINRLSYVKKSFNKYAVDVNKIPDSKINDKYKKAQDKNDYIISELEAFAIKRRGDLSSIDKNLLIKEFSSFLLDETSGSEYSEIISAFIVENQNNIKITELINLIKEGAVIYTGLNHNANLSNRTAWKDNICIYFEIEILFHLAGYNGEVFKRYAEDLVGLILEMNRKSQSHNIRMLYFEDVESEVESFFHKAENIISGKELIAIDNFAMKTITDGCVNPSDILQTKALFFKLIHAKGIVQADSYNYYGIENRNYNIEDDKCFQKYELSEDKERYIKHINYINILRKGNKYRDLKCCKHIILTEVGKMLTIANDLCSDNDIPLAINLYTLTNRLWFDLNKGFGACELPSNFSVLLKAQVVLSSLLSQSVSKKYEQAYSEYKNGNLDSDNMTEIILSLREETKKPEEIKIEDLDNVLSCISENDITIYQKEKERLSGEKNRLDEKVEELTKEIEKKDINLKQKENLNERLTEECRNLLIKNYDDKVRNKEKADGIITNKTKQYRFLIYTIIFIYYILIIVSFIIFDNSKRNILTGCLAVFPPFLGFITSLILRKKVSVIEIINYIVEKKKNKIKKQTYLLFDVDEYEIEELKSDIQKME